MITGVYTPTAGKIDFGDQEITGLEPFRINQMGIARTFQNIRLFPNLTVLDNVRIAYHPHAGYSLVDGILHNSKFQVKERELTERAQEFLAVFNLQDRQGEIATQPALRRAAPPGNCPRAGSRTPACCCWMNPPPE